jgi:hypothetical protein
MFGEERVRRFLENAKTDSAFEICEAVLREAYDFGNHPLFRLYDFLHSRMKRCSDDLTAVAFVRSNQ